MQNSERPSTYRTLAREAVRHVRSTDTATREDAPLQITAADTATDTATTVVKNNAIFFGDENVGGSYVECTRIISGASGKKAVMEVRCPNGTKAIAKCWGPQYFERFGSHHILHVKLLLIAVISFEQEAYTYEKLHENQPTGYNCFASVLGYGRIVCSSVFSSGFILVMTFAEGEPLNALWENLDPRSKQHVFYECRRAISILRCFRVWLADAGRHNVLYSRQSKRVTLIDFESVGWCATEEEARDLDAPELLAMFGDARVNSELIIGG